MSSSHVLGWLVQSLMDVSNMMDEPFISSNFVEKVRAKFLLATNAQTLLQKHMSNFPRKIPFLHTNSFYYYFIIPISYNIWFWCQRNKRWEWKKGRIIEETRGRKGGSKASFLWIEQTGFCSLSIILTLPYF